MDHIVYGWLFFSLVTAALVGLALRWREPEVPHAESSRAQTIYHWRPSRVARVLWFVVVVILIVLGGKFYRRLPMVSHSSQPAGGKTVVGTCRLATDCRSGGSAGRRSLKISNRRHRQRSERVGEVSLYIASYPVKRRGVELVSSANVVGASGEWQLHK